MRAHAPLRPGLVAAIFVVASGLVGACTRPDPPPPPPPPPPDKVEQDIVATSMHECFTLDCERAFAHVSALPSASPLRQTDVFQAIQYRHDAERLLAADVELDLTKRRSLFKAVADTPGIDTALRLVALQRIARLGSTATASEVPLNAPVTAAAEAAKARADLLAKSRSKEPEDQNAVRAKLEPKIFSGQATADDVSMLRSVCKAQHDAACLRQLDRLILR